MFKFLKEKLSNAINHFTKGVAKEVEEPKPLEDVKEEKPTDVELPKEDADQIDKEKAEVKKEEDESTQEKQEKDTDQIDKEKTEVKKEEDESTQEKQEEDADQIDEEKIKEVEQTDGIEQPKIADHKDDQPTDTPEVVDYKAEEKDFASDGSDEVLKTPDQEEEKNDEPIHKTEPPMDNEVPDKSEDLVDGVQESTVNEVQATESTVDDEIIDNTKNDDSINKSNDNAPLDKPKGFFDRVKNVFSRSKTSTVSEPSLSDDIGDKIPEQKPEVEEIEEQKNLFSKIGDSFTKKKLSSDKFEEMFFELEVVLLENNVAIEVIEKIKEDLSKVIVDKPLPRNMINKIIIQTLRESIESLFLDQDSDLISMIKEKSDKPFTILFVGVNGSGKTTTIAKLAHYLKASGMSVVISASDTFRAASIEQLQKHADKIGVKLMKHDYGSDAAAVAFDAINYAKSKNSDVVLIDTAGRLHSNVNLMDELKKVNRVANPDLKIFVGESITGNDCVEQSTKFNDAVSVDGIILSKADIDEKGGTAISVSYVTQKPILFLGMGQEYDDIEPFNKERLIESLGLG
ncbi:signal recognition particle-docking protein FtsY [Candidatus Woesearchaeota archaeon]|nr:signal recognition particle-docking protein FtsY [Candidatus Woesearchaeota archaeon]